MKFAPNVLLKGLYSLTQDAHELILITGESGSGKTTWCLELIRQARLLDISPQGVVSPGVFGDGIKMAIDLQEIETGERRRMAFHVTGSDQNRSSGPRTADWQFDAGVLEWGDRILQRLKGGDLLVIDELGPLELIKNQGLVSGLKLVDERNFRVTCVVIRPSLLAIAQERWQWGVVLDVTDHLSGLGARAS